MLTVLRRGPALVIALALASLQPSCGTVPDPPPYPGIRVEPIERGAWIGVRAEYTVHAPPGQLRRLFMTFDRPREGSRRIVSITPVEQKERETLVSVRFREPALGIEGNAVCRVRLMHNNAGARIRYEVIESDVSLWRFEGVILLVSADGGRSTLVRQEYRFTALSVDKAALLEAMREEAEAVRAVAEARAR